MKEILSYAKFGHVGIGYKYRKLYSNADFCPYCRTKLKNLGSFHLGNNIVLIADRNEAMCLRCGSRSDSSMVNLNRPNKDNDGNFQQYEALNSSPAVRCLFSVQSCGNCGWWYALEDANVGNNGDMALHTGILERFNWTSRDVPIEILKSELPKYSDKYHVINPYRMEDLVGDILGKEYNCEVHHLGYSRDGGIDLLLLLSDNDPIAVQVKRRAKDKTEGVKPIREFIGASMLKGYKDLLFVTTASKFSKDAIDAAQNSLEQKITNSFQLMNLSRLKEIMAENSESTTNWENAINKQRKMNEVALKVPDPFEFNSKKPSIYER